MKRRIVSVLLATALTLIPMTVKAEKETELLYATNVLPRTVASSLKDLTVTRNKLPVDNIIATGDIIEKDGKEYVAIVCGDANGDGNINSTDFIMVRKAYLNTYLLDKASRMAADVNFDKEINSTDFMRIRQHFLNKYSLGKEGGISFGEATAAAIGTRPTLYYSKNDTVYYSPDTVNLFGEIEYIDNYTGSYETGMASNASATMSLNIDGKNYQLNYKKNNKWPQFDDELQYYRTDDYAVNVLRNENTGETVRLVLMNSDLVDIDTVTQDGLRALAEKLVRENTNFVIDESAVYQCISYVYTYTLSENGYTSEYHWKDGFHKSTENTDGAETYDVLDGYKVTFTLYVNGIKTERYAAVEFRNDRIALTVYDLDFDSVTIDSEDVNDDLEDLLSDKCNDIFVDGEYEMGTPLIYRRDGRIYARIYCKGELMTSTEEWPLNGAYFVLDYGEG